MSSSKQHITKYIEAKKRPTSSRIVLYVGIAFFGLAAVLIYAHRDTLLTRSQCRNGDSSPLYDEAAKALKQGDIGLTNTAVTKIKQDKNYSKDPNCLYPVVAYYIMIEDADNAQSNYNRLSGVYNDKKGFATVYRNVGVRNLQDVKSSVDRLVSSKEKSNGSTHFFN